MIPGDKAYYPGTDVLINKQDIRDFAAARVVEYKFAAARELELAAKPIQGKFDFEHLQAIHKHVFQDMYEWAGQVREIDFAKGNKETGLVNRFIPAMVIDIKAEEFNKFIADLNQLQGLKKPEFLKAITEVHTKLDELHPFREGNGRSTRIFISELARKAGYELDIDKIPRDRWKLASHLAIKQHDPKNPAAVHVANQSAKREIFHEAIKPTLVHAFMNEARVEALKHYPSLKHAFERVDAIAQLASKMPDMNASTRLVAAETARIGAKLMAGVSPESMMNPYLQGKLGLQQGMQMAKQSTLSTTNPALKPTTPEKSSGRGMRM
jgi:cell filamentation protein